MTFGKLEFATFVIVVIFVLECIAISNGINGIVLGGAIASIAFIAGLALDLPKELIKKRILKR
jgi:hypothetical protein